MKLGVYTLVTPDYGIEEAAALIADIGYTGIEWTVDYANAVWDGESKWHINTDALEQTVTAVREATHSHNLTILCVCPRLTCHEADRIRAYLDLAHKVGSAALRVQSPRYDGSTHVDTLFEQARADYERAIEMARDVGVKIMVEVHNGLIVPSASAMRRLLDGLDPDWIGAVFDPGNMIREGMENWQMGVETLGPYLQHVHVKNGVWKRNEDGRWAQDSASLAEGLVDWPAVVEALKSVGYDGYLDIEDFRGGYARKPVGITTRDKLQEDYDYMTSLL